MDPVTSYPTHFVPRARMPRLPRACAAPGCRTSRTCAASSLLTRAAHPLGPPAPATAIMSPEDIDAMLKQVLLKDMRTQCRLRNLSPAGGKEQLSERLKEHMIATSDL